MTIIKSLASAASAEGSGLLAEAAQIFFETSLTKRFKSHDARQAFLGRWFGHYAELQPEAFYFALDGGGAVIGYLAGCFDSFSAESRLIVDSIPYYTPDFCAAHGGFPSHFHINITPSWQGRGVGRQLVERFADLCRERASPGIHVVTGLQSPAVLFYEACGFERGAPLGGNIALVRLL